MRRSALRKVAMAAVVTAAPVVALVAEAAPAAPAPQAVNFVCLSLGQLNAGLCLGPPVAAGMQQLG